MQRRQVLGSLGVIAITPVTASAAPVEISGTGATFPARVYQQWAEQYGRDTGAKIIYTPSGSSAGVKRIVDRVVDFGATDVPLGAKELSRQGLFQFPTLVGGVVPCVNLPGISASLLRLGGDVLVGIFGGRITRWNDKAITGQNPGLGLPDLPIRRVVRSEGSGTTEVFVDYLNRLAPAAKITLRAGIAQWPGTTIGAEGSSRLVAAVKATPGAIGYVSSDYVVRDDLTATSLINRRGEWVRPTLDAFRAAIQAGRLFKDDLEPTSLIDLDGPGVWPIVTATYVVVPRAPSEVERAARALNFFYRSFLLGDKAVAGTGFAPLPERTQARIVALLANFRTPDGHLVPVLGQAPQARAGGAA